MAPAASSASVRVASLKESVPISTSGHPRRHDDAPEKD
jgi:hypothetical protein